MFNSSEYNKIDPSFNGRMVVSKTTGGGSIPSGSAILDYGVMVSTSDFESGSSGSSPDSPASCQVDRSVR